MPTRYYDAFEGAKLMGVGASTIRSWVHRGHLQPGYFQRGRLTWTERQLAKARSVARRETTATTVGRATCSCGAKADVAERDVDIIASCDACQVSIAIPRSAVVGSLPAHPVALDPGETAIDSMESTTGPHYRVRAMGIYLRYFAPGPQVYFIRLGPYVKIGTSADVARRLSSLSLRLGHLMATVDGGVEVEKATHARFAHLNAFGEWFYLQDDLLQFVVDRQREQVQMVTARLST